MSGGVWMMLFFRISDTCLLSVASVERSSLVFGRFAYMDRSDWKGFGWTAFRAYAGMGRAFLQTLLCTYAHNETITILQFHGSSSHCYIDPRYCTTTQYPVRALSTGAGAGSFVFLPLRDILRCTSVVHFTFRKFLTRHRARDDLHDLADCTIRPLCSRKDTLAHCYSLHRRHCGRRSFGAPFTGNLRDCYMSTRDLYVHR